MTSQDALPLLEYVDDSEPERKRVRLEIAEKKKRRTRRTQDQNTIHSLHSRPFNCASKPQCSTREDMDTGEKREGNTTEANPVSTARAVSDIGDATRKYPRLSSVSSQEHTQSNPLEATDAITPHWVSSCSSIVTQEMSSDSDLVTCLGHFAYHKVRASNGVSASSRPSNNSRTSAHHIQNGKAEMRSQEPLPDSDMTKFNISRLLRCVSCDAPWTIQKGTSHKLSHITTCARKNGISSDTLRRLIERELLKMRGGTNDKVTAPSGPTEAASQTYVESVVAEAQPRRKQRRTDTASTLQPISQTRTAILDRAQALLRTGEDVPCDAPEPELTQAFGRSKLASIHMHVENTDPIVNPTEECALTSRLALLRSMAGPPL